MMPVHRQEEKQFKKLFKQENIDRLEDRVKILETFLQTENHVTEAELQALLETKGHRFDADFITDTLNLMRHYGFAQARAFDNGVTRYEHRHLGQHHDHMICTKCGAIIEFENQHLEDLQAKIAAAFGFHMLQHKMEIYGICSHCLKDRIDVMPLISARQGEKLVIAGFSGGSAARMRLLTMGLRIGEEIEIITGPNGGQLVVASNFTRFAIGRGLAEKIMVRRTAEAEAPDQRILLAR